MVVLAPLRAVIFATTGLTMTASASQLLQNLPHTTRLFGPGAESGDRPIRLPKLYIVAVDEPPGGFDGGLIINTVQLNHADGSVV
jgi:hypothetical protein